MEKLEGFYGVYFMKGAFYLDVKEVGGDLIAQPLHSKGSEKLHVIGGSYDSLEDLLASDKGSEVQEYIDSNDFDFLIIGYGGGVNYYINTKEGLKKCKATYIP